MEINSRGSAALYAIQKALQQPQQTLDVLQKSAKPEQSPATPPQSDSEDNEVAEMTGKGQKLNIVA